MATTKDNLALVVLCSTLGYSSAKSDKDSDTAVKPLTVTTFNKLETKLIEANLAPAVFLTEKLADIASRLGLTEKETDHIEKLLHRTDKLGEELDRLAEKKIYVTGRTQENYPSKLKAAMSKQSPIIFFYCGDMRLLDCETVAIVDSRESTDQEIEYASKHARISAQNNRVIVSGGAKGIDTIAKEAALHAGGKVVTYVSDNMTGYIEKNADRILYDRMLALSSFHPTATFKGYNALERNKYIYASSDYAVVVSSGDGTGGSFKDTADCLKNSYCPLYVKDDAFAPPGNKKLIELGGLPANEEHERLGR